VARRVEAAVREAFGHLSPRDAVTFEAFSELTLRVRKIVEGATPEERIGGRWLQYLLPPRDMEEFVMRESGVIDPGHGEGSGAISQPLRRLLDETADIVESPSFGHVLTLLLDAGFSFLVDQQLATSAFDHGAPAPTAAASDDGSVSLAGAKRAVLLPRILSVLTRQARVIGNGMPNEYLREMEQVGDLEGFAAVVYSSNWESEITDEGIVGVDVGVDTEVQQGKSNAPARGPQVGEEEAAGEESIVMIDTHGSLESAWEKAVAAKE
jgi:peroxin-3